MIVGIPSIDRPDELATLLNFLVPQKPSTIYVCDNGYDPPIDLKWLDKRGLFNDEVPIYPHHCKGDSIHWMWNHILLSGRGPKEHVVILNDDLWVGPHFLADLTAPLEDPDVWMSWVRRDDQFLMPAGWAFAVSKHCPLLFDEQFEWWCGENDFYIQVIQAGKKGAVVDTDYKHLYPNKSTYTNADRYMMGQRDIVRYKEKWSLPVREAFAENLIQLTGWTKPEGTTLKP